MRGVGLPLLLIGIFFLNSIVFAVEILSIDSPKIRISIPPGEEKTGLIKVTNPSPQPKEARVYLEDWRYLPPFDGSKEFKPAGSLPFSASSWISFLPKEFKIPPYGTQLVTYRVKIPKYAKGGHFSVLFFEELLGKPKVDKGVGIGVAIRIASLFYIEPEGTIIRKAKIENLSLKKEGRQLKIEADFNNIGNTDITCKGTFHIIDKKGMVYARGKFNDIYTFPGDVAKLKADASCRLELGFYDLVITLQYQDGSVNVIEKTIKVSEWGKIEIISSK